MTSAGGGMTSDRRSTAMDVGVEVALGVNGYKRSTSLMTLITY